MTKLVEQLRPGDVVLYRVGDEHARLVVSRIDLTESYGVPLVGQWQQARVQFDGGGEITRVYGSEIETE